MQDPREAGSDQIEDKNAFFLRTVNGSAGESTIVLQNQNGPCALVAIANTLVLEDAPTAAFVRAAGEKHSQLDDEALKAHLGEVAGSRSDDPQVFAALAQFLPKLTEGLDVNPRFDGTFEDTPELNVFASFNIPIVHGWVLGDLEREEFGITDSELSHISYERFCELQFSDSPDVKLGAFVEQYSSQLTASGFMHLLNTVPNGNFAVLFWNNHFSTILNHDNQLLILATDLGYQFKPEIVWEVLEPSGAGLFLNGNFESSDQQIMRDAELAKQLEEEEKSRSLAAASAGITKANGRQGRSASNTHREKGTNNKSTSAVKSAKPSDGRRTPESGNEEATQPTERTKKKKKSEGCVLM